MLRRSALAALCSALPHLPAAGLAAPTDGETPPIELDPLTVTAPRLDAEALDTATPVSTYDGRFIAETEITDFAGLAPLVPGFFASIQSPNNPSYNLRGLTSDNLDPRAEERVAVYQDNITISRTQGASVALFDLDRVDVFKGPQPTRFLRGAQSGALIITSNRARDEDSASFTVGAGDHGSRLAEGHVNASVAPGSLSARVAFHLSENDGLVNNLTPGAGKLQGEDTAALRASLRWQPAPDARTTVDLVFNHQRDTPPGTAFKSMDIPTRRGDTDPYSAADLNRGDALGLDRTVSGLALLLRTELTPAWTLHATTGARRHDALEEYDADGSNAYLIELGNDQWGEQFSQELRFRYDAGERLTATLGGGVFWERGRQDVIIRSDERRLWAFLAPDFRDGLIAAGVPAPLAGFAVPVGSIGSAFAPDASLPATLPAEFGAFANPALPPALQALAGLAGAPLSASYGESYTADAENRSAELLGEFDFEVTERLSFGASFRVTQAAITSGYESRDSGAGTLGFILTGGSTNNAYRPTAGRLELTEDHVSWAGDVHALYRLSPRLQAYTSFARGVRPPSLSHNQSTLAPIRLEEEVVWNHEAGLKGTSPTGRLAYDVSVFHYTYENFQTQATTAPGVISATDGGRARGRGAEASVQGAITRHLTLFGSYGFTDAEFSAFDEDGTPQAYAGNSFRLASRHTIALGGTGVLPVTDHGAFYLTPVWQYRSEHFFEDNNQLSGGRLRQAGFGLVNVTLAYRPRRGFWEAALHVQNAFDHDYLIDAGNLGASFGIPTTVRGSPRTVAARFTARF